MKKILSIILLFYFADHLAAQGPVTQKIFYNLPIGQGKDAIQRLLLADTLHFKAKAVKDFYNFSILQTDSFFGSLPDKIFLSVRDFKSRGDSLAHPEMTLLVNYDKVSTKRMKLFYDALTNKLQNEYDEVRHSYSKGEMRDGRHRQPVDENFAGFYLHKGDKKEKLSCAWLDQGKKYGHLVMITYRFD